MQEIQFSFTLFLSMAQVQTKQMDLERYNSPSVLGNLTKYCVTTLLLLIFARLYFRDFQKTRRI